MPPKGQLCPTFFLLALILLSTVPIAWSQARIPDNFSGKWIEYYQDGSRKSETIFENGRKNGIGIYWYQPDCPMSIHHFKQDILHGPMVKWEKCEDIIAVGEYRNGEPWNGYFLVNPATAIPIIDITVYESNLSYYVIQYTNGKHFTPLLMNMRDRYMSKKPIYKKLLENLNLK